MIAVIGCCTNLPKHKRDARAADLECVEYPAKREVQDLNTKY
ncbi:hypothetical protein U370_03335 [Anaplasma marginale str. Dawn]|nr:hypothetical protein U370_03335 [Anaplasma marginale str. Dawn]